VIVDYSAVPFQNLSGDDLSQDSRCTGKGTNPGPSDHETQFANHCSATVFRGEKGKKSKVKKLYAAETKEQRKHENKIRV